MSFSRHQFYHFNCRLNFRLSLVTYFNTPESSHFSSHPGQAGSYHMHRPISYAQALNNYYSSNKTQSSTWYFLDACSRLYDKVCWSVCRSVGPQITLIGTFKPVTDEQVFYDKFSYDKFYLPSARVYMQHILYDKFSYDKFYFTGVNVSTSLL